MPWNNCRKTTLYNFARERGIVRNIEAIQLLTHICFRMHLECWEGRENEHQYVLNGVCLACAWPVLRPYLDGAWLRDPMRLSRGPQEAQMKRLQQYPL